MSNLKRIVRDCGAVNGVVGARRHGDERRGHDDDDETGKKKDHSEPGTRRNPVSPIGRFGRNKQVIRPTDRHSPSPLVMGGVLIDCGGAPPLQYSLKVPGLIKYPNQEQVQKVPAL